MQFEFKTPPFDHQERFIAERYHYREDALFWEQGTAKTKAVLDKLAKLYCEQEVNGLLVMAPEDVHVAWVQDEMRKHLMDGVANQTRAYIYHSHKAGTQKHKEALHWLCRHDGMAVMTITDSAVRTEGGRKAIWNFLKHRKTLFSVDESTRIKTPSAKVTQRIIAAGKYAPYKVIMTGTPLAKGPFDAYSQVRFLLPDYWKKFDFDSATAFRAYFGQFKEIKLRHREGSFPKLLGYRHLEELGEMLAAVSTRYLKEDVLDLPPKLYTTRYYDLTPEQARVYLELEQEYRTFVDAEGPCPQCGGRSAVEPDDFPLGCDECGGTGVRAYQNEVVAEMAMVRQMRLHQVTCGYLPTPNPLDEEQVLVPIGDHNPRLESYKHLMDETPGKMITWCRFRRDVDNCLEVSTKANRAPVRYDGSVPKGDQRTRARHEFQEGGSDDFVGTPASAGEGLTLHAAKTVAFYSQDYKYKDRKQAEDRAHRAGMSDQPVLYVDFVGRVQGRNTVDKSILDNHSMKGDVAAQVLGDAR